MVVGGVGHAGVGWGPQGPYARGYRVPGGTLGGWGCVGREFPPVPAREPALAVRLYRPVRSVFPAERGVGIIRGLVERLEPGFGVRGLVQIDRRSPSRAVTPVVTAGLRAAAAGDGRGERERGERRLNPEALIPGHRVCTKVR